jgi:lysophospholipase L1-like esterase
MKLKVILPGMKRFKFDFLVAFFIIAFIAEFKNISAQTNLSFESGLKGWRIIGARKNVSIDKNNAYQGNCCSRIGEENGGLVQRMSASPFAIIEYSVYIKSNKTAMNGYSYIRFYNSRNSLLLEFKNRASLSTTYQKTGNYTEAPAKTRWVEIGIKKDSSIDGFMYADKFSINLNVDGLSGKHKPICNLDQYMHPFWKSDTIYNETVLMFSVNGKPADGKLLYIPSQTISVRSFDLKKTYEPGIDYSTEGNVIKLTPNSKIPFKSDTSFDTKTNLAWYNLQSQWIEVTYTHADAWDGPVPTYKGDKMPNTIRKLVSKKPLKIMAFGMSITRGYDVSGYDTVPPYMPTYVELLKYSLKKKYGYDDITLFNAALPGSIVSWGADYTDKYINPIKPDLVIIDFGMNDFWRYTPEQFITYVKTIMNKAKVGNENVEFLLLSNMMFDPDYMLDTDKNKTWYVDNMKGYNIQLQQLETIGAINLDMTTLSESIYRRKKAKDCLANPLHPNDYLARWYAQGMAALFIKH